ncbi:transposase [Streptomyces sp. NPDC057486]|uniref:transposase n=1 Tax=Streptomyces sp. NPDC057486 TaxID=3346145 RepID=UPI0036A0F094
MLHRYLRRRRARIPLVSAASKAVAARSAVGGCSLSVIVPQTVHRPPGTTGSPRASPGQTGPPQDGHSHFPASRSAAPPRAPGGGNPERMRTEASFAALCGAAPGPASSGRTSRHRLSRGGDRGANAALYRSALVRMAGDSRTREYVARQTAAGRTKKEIIRLLKRAIVREMFRCLTTTVTVPDIADLQPLQQSKNITLTAAARHFGLWPTAISHLERVASPRRRARQRLPGLAQHRLITR